MQNNPNNPKKLLLEEMLRQKYAGRLVIFEVPIDDDMQEKIVVAEFESYLASKAAPHLDPICIDNLGTAEEEKEFITISFCDTSHIDPQYTHDPNVEIPIIVVKRIIKRHTGPHNEENRIRQGEQEAAKNYGILIKNGLADKLDLSVKTIENLEKPETAKQYFAKHSENILQKIDALQYLATTGKLAILEGDISIPSTSKSSISERKSPKPLPSVSEVIARPNAGTVRLRLMQLDAFQSKVKQRMKSRGTKQNHSRKEPHVAYLRERHDFANITTLGTRDKQAGYIEVITYNKNHVNFENTDDPWEEVRVPALYSIVKECDTETDTAKLVEAEKDRHAFCYDYTDGLKDHTISAPAVRIPGAKAINDIAKNDISEILKDQANVKVALENLIESEDMLIMTKKEIQDIIENGIQKKASEEYQKCEVKTITINTSGPYWEKKEKKEKKEKPTGEVIFIDEYDEVFIDEDDDDYADDDESSRHIFEPFAREWITYGERKYLTGQKFKFAIAKAVLESGAMETATFATSTASVDKKTANAATIASYLDIKFPIRDTECTIKKTLIEPMHKIEHFSMIKPDVDLNNDKDRAILQILGLEQKLYESQLQVNLEAVSDIDDKNTPDDFYEQYSIKHPNYISFAHDSEIAGHIRVIAGDITDALSTRSLQPLKNTSITLLYADIPKGRDEGNMRKNIKKTKNRLADYYSKGAINNSPIPRNPTVGNPKHITAISKHPIFREMIVDILDKNGTLNFNSGQAIQQIMNNILQETRDCAKEALQKLRSDVKKEQDTLAREDEARHGIFFERQDIPSLEKTTAKPEHYGLLTEMKTEVDVIRHFRCFSWQQLIRIKGLWK